MESSPLASDKHASLNVHAYTESYKKSDLTLQLLARGKADAKSGLPTLLEGDPITGTVVLDVREKSPIKSVSVAVRWMPLAYLTTYIDGP